MSEFPIGLSGPDNHARKNPEAALQAQIVAMIRKLAYKDLVWGMSMSGVKLGPRAAKRMKAQGMNAGEADLWFLLDGTYYGLEIKNGKEGKQSAVQKDFERRVKATGGFYFIARSLENAQHILERIGAIKPAATSIGRAA